MSREEALARAIILLHDAYKETEAVQLPLSMHIAFNRSMNVLRPVFPRGKADVEDFILDITTKDE